MAKLLDNILTVSLLTLCLLEIHYVNTTQPQPNPFTKNAVQTSVKQSKMTTVNETVINHTHKGREHVTDAPNFEENASNLTVNKPILKKNESSVKENNKEFNTSKVNITTTRKPTKPIITEHGDELKSHEDSIITHVDTNMDKRVRRAEYIVPIVGVILSVPFVAVVISLVYKKGKDWWQHRNYRRMDYLIEGMYNS